MWDERIDGVRGYASQDHVANLGDKPRLNFAELHHHGRRRKRPWSMTTVGIVVAAVVVVAVVLWIYR